MTERNFNVAHNEELTPSVQPVKTFSGASHKTLARYVNDTESTMTQSLDVSIACQRFQLAGIIVLADGENFSSVDVTATAYKNHENRKYQLATETISLPATNAGNMGHIAATMSGYEDFVDSIAFSGTISIAAGGSVTIIALFKGGEDSALSELVSKIDEIADNTSIQEPYRLLEVDSNGVLRNNTTTKKKIDISGATSVQANVLSYAYSNNTNIEGPIDFSSLTSVSSARAFTYTFSGCSNITSVDFSNLETINGENAFSGTFQNCTKLTEAYFPNLKHIAGQNAFSSCFINSGITRAVFPELLDFTSGGYCLTSIFQNCTKLTEAYFPKLENAVASAFSYAFRGSGIVSIAFPKLSNVSAPYCFSDCFYDCTSLTDVYFNALTTTSFGSNTNQFINIVRGTSDVKLHFPSNLTATIAGLSGYPNFSGTNTQVLFDLDPTE